jgi:hypothetical protein
MKEGNFIIIIFLDYVMLGLFRALEKYVGPSNFFFLIWFVKLLAVRPLLAYCASLG